MRVISGTARHLILKTLPGNDTRPTTDMIKETLFNMINFDLPGARFLDLYAGSGAIGIEALSRGAVSATFIDNNAKAIAIIKENLEHTRFTDLADVITAEAVSGLRRIEASKKQYDIVFMDPPYSQGFEESALRYLKTSKIIDSDTLIIIEMSKDTDIENIKNMGFEVEKIKAYKTNKHIFVRRRD